MKTLEEHNRDAARKYVENESATRRLEVECPKCGAAIEYDTRVVLMSQPPQVNANCTVCCWHGPIAKP